MSASESTAEVIVVANRCVDRTEAIATANGAIVLQDTSRSIAAIRNVGVRASTGEIVVTIDADNLVHERALMEVNRLSVAPRSVDRARIRESPRCPRGRVLSQVRFDR